MPVPRGPERLGLFLQERARPQLVYTLVIDTLPCGSGSVLERTSAKDTTFSFSFEKSDRQAHEKFVYDVRAKALVGRFSYQPIEMVRLFPTPDGAVVVAFDVLRDGRLRIVERLQPADQGVEPP